MKFQAKKLKDLIGLKLGGLENVFQLKENFAQQLFSEMIFPISTFLIET